MTAMTRRATATEKKTSMKLLANQSSVWPRSKDDFEARKPQGHEDNSQAVNLEPAVAPRGFDLTRELRRIRYQTFGENQRQDSDGNG